MDARTLVIRITGMIILWLLSVAPGIYASATMEQPARRQTEFNDRNYQPSQQVNTSKPVAPVTRNRPKAERHNQRVIQSNLERVAWTNARGAQTEYRVYYEYDSTHITFASVCSNYRQGSIDYRNCRKAAKQWFGQRCNTSTGLGRMYCQADSSFRP